MKMRSLFTILFSLVSTIIFGQNLIYNGGFEILKECPDKFENLELATGWYHIYSSGSGTVQIRNLCSDISFFNQAIPRVRKPRTGNGYALMLAGENQIMQTRLTKKLDKNKYYKVEFYLQTNPESRCALTPIFGLLTKYSNYDSIIKYEDLNKQVFLEDYKELLNPDNWVRVEGIYKARGNEMFFTLGYINIHNKPFCFCAYSIDDISVTPLLREDSIPQHKVFLDSLNLEQGDVFTLKNVNFEFDKSELLQESQKTLNELFDFLKRNTDIIISINGHTDNLGTEEHNLKLSEDRAKSVFDYLVEKGISKEKMRYKGFGSSKPLNDNSTETNRQNNRRVEIKIESKN